MEFCRKIKDVQKIKYIIKDVSCDCSEKFLEWTGDLLKIFCPKLKKTKYFSKNENRLLTESEMNEISKDWR